jgi:hypothetical protein
VRSALAIDPYNSTVNWNIEVGEKLPRSEVSKRYGGNAQSGIAASRTSPNILVFSTFKGHRFGYVDEWSTDGFYHYTGEGQRGDQLLTAQGNQALLNQPESGRTIRLFKQVGTMPTGGAVVNYEGAFDLDTVRPWYSVDAMDDQGVMRSVVVFRFRPRSADASQLTYATALTVVQVPVESQHIMRFSVEPSQGPRIAERREAKLNAEYYDYLRSQGHSVCRLAINLPGQAMPLYTDLFDNSTKELVETKASAARENVRMAIGQLADYRRKVKCDTVAILVPVRPSDDLIDLINSQKIHCLYRKQNGGFGRISPMGIEVERPSSTVDLRLDSHTKSEEAATFRRVGRPLRRAD